MWYTTKKAILEHLGKNGRDVKQLDRLIKKWVVIAKEWRYAYRCDLEIAHIRKLKAERGNNSFGDVSQLKSDLDFQIAENDKLIKKHEEEIKDITKRCREYMNKRWVPPVDSMAQFKYWIKWEDYKDIQFSPEEIQGGLNL